MSDAPELTLSEQDHAAVQEQVVPGVSPANLLDAMDDPDAFAGIARADLYINMARMRQRSAHPEFSATHLLEYSKFLAKMGKVDAPDKSASMLDNMPRIEIILPNSGASVSIGGYNPSEREVSQGADFDDEDEDVGADFDDMPLADDDDDDNGFGSGKPSQAVLP